MLKYCSWWMLYDMLKEENKEWLFFIIVGSLCAVILFLLIRFG